MYIYFFYILRIFADFFLIILGIMRFFIVNKVKKK
jgi:hypothetical protein